MQIVVLHIAGISNIFEPYFVLSRDMTIILKDSGLIKVLIGVVKVIISHSFFNSSIISTTIRGGILVPLIKPFIGNQHRYIIILLDYWSLLAIATPLLRILGRSFWSFAPAGIPTFNIIQDGYLSLSILDIDICPDLRHLKIIGGISIV